MTTVFNCLKEGIEFLNSKNIPEAKISAEQILSQILNKPNHALYLDSDLTVDHEKQQEFLALLTKRAHRYPLQYLMKEIPFRNIRLEIGEGCLIPRPETEILVDLILKQFPEGDLKVLDIGTGSGNIAVSLTFERNWHVIGTDPSEEALKYARRNAKLNSVENKTKFIQTDLWNSVQDKDFDLIISNPPYLTTGECNELQPELFFEPRIALDGGEDGLAFFNRIIQNAHQVLKSGGRVFFEVGYGQSRQVAGLFNRNHFTDIQIHKDDSGIERIVSGKFSPQSAANPLGHLAEG